MRSHIRHPRELQAHGLLRGTDHILRASAFDLTEKPHRNAPVRLLRLTYPCRDAARSELGRALPYHSRITQQSPTGQTVPDPVALTCDFMPALDWRRRPWAVPTTCARWYRGTVRGSEPERLPVRRSGIAGCSVVSRSPVRPSHVVRNLPSPGEEPVAPHLHATPRPALRNPNGCERRASGARFIPRLPIRPKHVCSTRLSARWTGRAPITHSRSLHDPFPQGWGFTASARRRRGSRTGPSRLSHGRAGCRAANSARELPRRVRTARGPIWRGAGPGRRG